MDRYQKVEKPKVEAPIAENEIRITSQGRMRSYIAYALTLLQEKGSDDIVFKAMGRAINKTVTIVELIKRRIVGLHQISAIQSTDITDTWEPLEEGLQTLETTRKVSMITITLSKTELDKAYIGYQSPIPADQVKVSTELDYDGEGSPSTRGRGRGGRGRGRRAPSGKGFAPGEYEDGGFETNRGYERGRGRGRGRSFRGRGRGAYNGTQMDAQHDVESYNQEAPRGNSFAPGEYEDGGFETNRGYERGRGRGRGRSFRGRGRGAYNGTQMDAQHDVESYNQEAPRGNDFAPGEYEDGGFETNRGYERGRGRGRGRSFRGRGRGAYNGTQMDALHDVESYNQEAPRGRGRGRAPRGRRGGGLRSNGLPPVEAAA